jgi:hypothetical protein
MVIISMIEYLGIGLLVVLAIKGWITMCRGENVFERRRYRP